ncbi:energy transducer TonB [Lysobacter sp. H21R4]|nr:energy transducer TonB [Lysobacter sp. H21R4]
MIEMGLFLAVALAGPASVSEPASCIRTSISESGRTSKSKVIVSSGDKAHDRGALQFLRALDFSRIPMGVELGQTGHIMIRASAPGMYTVDVTEGRLLSSCPGIPSEHIPSGNA